MRKELFDELVESVKEGMAILRGEKEPAKSGFPERLGINSSLPLCLE
jgi:hypothetical protein